LYEYALHPDHLTSVGDSTVTRATITDKGALSVSSGRRTGRVPKEKRIVYDETTKDVSVFLYLIRYRQYGGAASTFHLNQKDTIAIKSRLLIASTQPKDCSSLMVMPVGIRSSKRSAELSHQDLIMPFLSSKCLLETQRRIFTKDFLKAAQISQ